MIEGNVPYFISNAKFSLAIDVLLFDVIHYKIRIVNSAVCSSIRCNVNYWIILFNGTCTVNNTLKQRTIHSDLVPLQ